MELYHVMIQRNGKMHRPKSVFTSREYHLAEQAAERERDYWSFYGQVDVWIATDFFETPKPHGRQSNESVLC